MEMVYQIRKSRGINWTHEEKEYLVQLCCQRARIIEDKRSDVHTLRKKAVAWKAVYDKFSARFGQKRPPVRVKEQWKRMKIAARAEMRGKLKGAGEEAGAAIVVLGEGDSTRSKYCSESEELLTQVQAILNSEYPEGYENEDTIGDMDCADLGVPEPIVIKVESDTEEMENKEFYDADMGLTLSHRHDEYGSRSNSSPVPINIVPVTEKIQQTDSKHHSNRYGHERYGYELPYGNCLRNPSSTQITNKVSKRQDHTDVYNDGTDTNTHKNEIYAEYAKREHLRKMEIMEKEHQARMEILKIEREIAIKKLRKAELKLTMNSLSSI